MPGSYTIELELFSLLNGSTDGFEIYADGALLGGYSSVVSSDGSTISINVPYGGALPTSLEFRFNDTAPGSVDQIEVRSVKINDRYVNTGNYLSGTILNDGGSQTVDVTNNAFLFDASEPAASEFTTGATQTFTVNNDRYREFDDPTPQVFDMLAGRDLAYLGAGADKVSGGDGDDTLYGFGGNDLLFGGAGNDRIYGGDDDDTLYGGDDDDRIHGNDGNDEIHGGSGDDRLNGHTGDDIITGGTGADKINGGSGNNFLFGDEGDDQIIGGANNDTIDGGADNDLLYGLGGVDQMNGGAGNDTLIGGLGDDIMHGDGGNDVMFGQADDDTMFGGAGEDYISGGDGIDIIDGGADFDILTGGAGADTINGGAGDDFLHGHGLNSAEIRGILSANPNVTYNAYTNSFYEYVSAGTNYIASRTAAETSSLSGISGHLATITSQFEDTYLYSISGGNIWISSTDEITEGQWNWRGGADDGLNFWNGTGGAGSGVLGTYENWVGADPNDGASGQDYGFMRSSDGRWQDEGGGGSREYIVEWDAGLINDDNAIDILNGGTGNDMIYGYGGDDILSGGADNDIIFGGDDNDTITGGIGNDVLYGQEGNDQILGGTGDDTLVGGAGNDVLVDETGIDTLDGGAGDDEVDAGAGDDTIIGGTGDDRLVGGTGNDTIDGGDDDDTIFGDGNAIMQAGLVTTNQADGNQWHTINFDAVITNPVIKLSMLTENDADPITLRVRNVGDTGFEWQIDEYEYLLDGGVHGTETVSWMAVASGTHTLEDGTVIQANTTTATNNSFRNVTFNSAFMGTAPVIATQIMTTNESTAAVLHNENRSLTGFRLQIEEQEANGTAHATETVGWIAIQGGGSAAGGFLVGETGNTVQNGTTNINFGGTFANTPVVIHDQQTEDGGDTAISRGSAFSTTGFSVSIEEEQSNDAEVTHTTEVVGYYALNEGVTYDSEAGTGDDDLRGGAGLDTLYGGAGADDFIFEATSAFADLDVIKDFNTVQNDAIDISDLLTVAFSGTITDFVNFVDDGTNITVQVDVNGTNPSGPGFQNITLLEGNTGLDEATLFANGNIIV